MKPYFNETENKQSSYNFQNHFKHVFYVFGLQRNMKKKTWSANHISDI